MPVLATSSVGRFMTAVLTRFHGSDSFPLLSLIFVAGQPEPLSAESAAREGVRCLRVHTFGA
jgi:hypothetical protein